MTMANFNVCVKAITWPGFGRLLRNHQSVSDTLWIPQSGFSQRAYRELTNSMLSDLDGDSGYCAYHQYYMYMPY